MKKMLNELVRYGKFAFALAFALCCFSASAAKKSVEITLNQSLATSEITTGLPALVRLSESSISGFSYTDCTGSNMKFTDAGGNELAYEVDTWNTIGESLVWVKLPSSAANTKITLTYGDGVTPSAPSTDVWSDYVGVWHLNGSVGATHADVTVADSTANGYVATAKGAVAGGYSEGKIGSAWNVYSTETISSGSYKVGILVNDNTISLGSSYTVSAWVKHYDNSFNYDHLFYRKTGSTASDGGYASEITAKSSASLDVYGNGATKFQFTNFPDTNQKWAHVALCYDSSSVYPYVNGAVVGTGGTIAPKEGTLAIAFGTDSDNNDTCPWHGDFDELRIRKGSRNDDYLAAEYAAMNTSGTDIFNYGVATDVGGSDPTPSYELGWTAEEMTAGGAGFRTDGTLLYAYSKAGTSVNGIPFTNISFTDLKLTTSAAPNVYISTVTGDKNSYGQEGQTGDFASMLANCWIWPSTQGQPVTITLKGLTEGKTYLVQLFAHRNNVDITAVVSQRNDMTFAVDEQVVKIGDKCDVNDNDDVVYLGGSLIGIIQPTASTYDIQVTYAGGLNASFPLNAIQVRELSENPAPAPLTGDYYVSTTGSDSNAGTSREEPLLTIAAAVTKVGAASDKTIVVLEGTHEITATISLNYGTKLIGEGMNKTTIQPASGKNIRCVELNGGAKLEGVTVTGGASSSGSGAGVLVKNGTVSWCRISNNKCTVGSTGGAGVSFDGGQGTIDHSVVVGNVMSAGSWGGGIGANGLAGSVLIDTCLISCNTAVVMAIYLFISF